MVRGFGIEPLRGAGPIVLGMTRSAVRLALEGARVCERPRDRRPVVPARPRARGRVGGSGEKGELQSALLRHHLGQGLDPGQPPFVEAGANAIRLPVKVLDPGPDPEPSPIDAGHGSGHVLPPSVLAVTAADGEGKLRLERGAVARTMRATPACARPRLMIDHTGL